MATRKRQVLEIAELEKIVSGMIYTKPAKISRKLGIAPTHGNLIVIGQALSSLGWCKFSRQVWTRGNKE